MKPAFFAFYIFCYINALSQATNLSPGAQLLFQKTKCKLTNAEKENIFKQSGFLISPDKKQFIADKDAADFPFAAFVYPTDLNKDGKEEIFILFGNSFTSGHTGSSIVAFIKNASNQYIKQLGFPGTLPDVVTASSTGYPDLIIGGPGFEFPVWKWKGSGYSFSKNIKDAELGKMKTENIENISRKHTEQIK